ncbi:uncharacterized protein I303_108252 [Kwoniella dejecticola CBS 10117]|uniref:Uncharacterized protein n=1 Tax=Kwoniella dejecticola CBS 10117 TaxID=1296121 RepID=A0A1A5ZXZ5_9TREE|nr:uncharacterized protein I303_07421 [Kwoniella dejecticola CBS 10117]OBR82658.1 hypothetical protein I303_07421 [Kwoniella dejecticola CBS 10117]
MIRMPQNHQLFFDALLPAASLPSMCTSSPLSVASTIHDGQLGCEASPASAPLSYDTLTSPVYASSPLHALLEKFTISGQPCRLSTFVGKNLGLRANNRIKRGALIMEESPLMCVEVDALDQRIRRHRAYRAFTKLPSTTQDIILALHARCDTRAEPDELVNIVATNSIPLQGDPFEPVKKVGLFETSSRIHPERWMDVVRGRTTASYKSLKEKWLDVPIIKCAASSRKHLKDLATMESILTQEGKLGSLGQIYDQAFEVSAIRGEVKVSKIMAQNALDHYSTIWGRKKAFKHTNYGIFADDPTQLQDWDSFVAQQSEAKKKRRRI